MESVKYCAYNTTKASFLNLRITVVDTLNERFDDHMEGLAHNAQAGLWLNPCRELPVGEGLPAFDLIYLDEACRVVQVVELSPGVPRAVPAATAASALALPSHTISASQTKCGDELMIWASYGEEKQSGRMSRAAAAVRVGPVRESAIASVLAVPGESAPSWAGENAGLPQAAFERLDEKEKAESTPEEKPTLTARFKSWTSENVTHRSADVPISVIPVSVTPASVARASIAPASVAPAQVLRASIAPAPVAPPPVTSAPVTPAAVARGTESFLAKESAALSRAVSPPAGDVPTRLQGAFEQLDENEMVEFTHEERPSFTSRLRNWTSERLAHQSAGEPASITADPVSPASITFAPVSIASASASIIPAPVSIALASVEPARVMPASIAPGAMTPAPVTQAPVTQARVIQAPVIQAPVIQAPVIQAPVPSAAIRHASVAPAADVQRTESFVAKPSPAPRSAAPFSAVAPARRPQAATERWDGKENAESRPVEKPSAVTPFKTRNAESLAQQRADAPIAVTPAAMPPAAVARGAASLLTKQSPTEQAAAPAPAGELPARPPASIERMGAKKKAVPKYERKHSWLTRLVRWVSGTAEPAERYHLPGLVAYFWTGGSPQAHPVSNISTSGLYLLTKERWMSDTVLLMNLQSAGTEKGKSADSISVLSRVVRRGEDGVGLKFVTPDSLDKQAGQMLPPIKTDKETLERFLKGFKRAEQVAAK